VRKRHTYSWQSDVHAIRKVRRKNIRSVPSLNSAKYERLHYAEDSRIMAARLTVPRIYNHFLLSRFTLKSPKTYVLSPRLLPNTTIQMIQMRPHSLQFLSNNPLSPQSTNYVMGNNLTYVIWISKCCLNYFYIEFVFYLLINVNSCN
jgi:hypothetical protein